MEVKNIMIRKPSVAGLFYESNKSLLEENIKNIFNKTGQNIPTTPSNTYKTKAAIVPHAGYIYSGKTAVMHMVILQEVVFVILLLLLDQIIQVMVMIYHLQQVTLGKHP